MAVAIRLMRQGKKHTPIYRIVVMDKRKKRDGAYIENIGIYKPLTEPAQIDIKKDRFDYWAQRGAQISEGLRKLLKYAKKLETKKPTKA